MSTVAQTWPARTDTNGTTWYRPHRLPGMDIAQWGWTSLKDNADLSYFEPGAPAPIPADFRNDVDIEGRWPTDQQIESAQPRRELRAAGVGSSGRSDISERIEELMYEPRCVNCNRTECEGGCEFVPNPPLISQTTVTLSDPIVKVTTTTREASRMAKAKDQFDEPDDAPRFTQYSRYPLPPAPPRFKVTYDGYGRYKLPSPTTGRPTAFSRSTTIADTLDETYNLNRWKRRQAVKAIFKAFAEIEAEPSKITADGFDQAGGEKTLRDYLQDALEAVEAEDDRKLDAAIDALDNLTGGRDAAELGEAVHAWLEAVDIGTVLPADVPEKFQPYLVAYRDALRRAGLVPLAQYVERVVLNDRGEETIAGTIDRIFLVVATGELVMGDVKTSKTLEYSWLTYSVQVGGVYGYATKMMRADGDVTQGQYGWEPMPEINQDYAIILHVPSDQPERSAAVTIDMFFGGDTMIVSLDVRRRRKDAKKAVPFVHEIPVPTKEALRYVQARDAVLDVASPDELGGVWEQYEDVWTDDLTALGEHVAELLSAHADAPASA